MSRALRRHHAARVAAKRRDLALAYYRDGVDREHFASMSDNELAVRHPFDCGRRCLMCHMDKLTLGGRRRARWKRETEREAVFS